MLSRVIGELQFNQFPFSPKARPMSELYLSTDGYKPLRLPSSGLDLIPGRQYWLDSVARDMVESVFGLRGCPAIITCILARRPKTMIESKTTNLDTGEVKEGQPVILEAQDATFNAFVKFRRVLKFTLDLEKLAELRPMYCSPHAVSDDNDEGEAKPERKKKVYDLSILDL